MMSEARQEAFGRAGVKSAEQRLNEAVERAIDGAGGDYGAALAALAGVVRDDAGVLWHLLAPGWPAVARRLLGAAFQDRQPAAAPANRPRVGPRAMATAAALVSFRLLDDHLTELGKALGDCTAEEVRALALRHTKKGRFYGWVAAGLPPGGVVRDYLPEEEARALWRRAEGMNDVE